jgi:hypothetical protein
MSEDEKGTLRDALLVAHPEWAGRIWINRHSVTVRGLGNVGYLPMSADDLLFYFDDLSAPLAADKPADAPSSPPPPRAG